MPKKQMKYIRTKKGEIGKLDNTEAYIKGKWYSVDEIKDYILAQADTIEELCDKFVYVDKESELNMPSVAIRVRFETIIKIANKCNLDLYGAIWTDKGLIYVAKMNEKGELELI